MRRIRLISMGLVMLAQLSLTERAKADQRLITISEETTRIIEPLDEDGFPDYRRAYDIERSQGVDLTNNAVVGIREVIGDEGIPSELRESYYSRLTEGQPFEKDGPLFQFLRDRLDVKSKLVPLPGAKPAANRVDLMVQPSQSSMAVARRAPWDIANNQELGAWVNKNQTAYNQLKAALSREKFYDPIISDADLLDLEFISLPHQELDVYFSVLATLKIGEGELESAVDAIVCQHRFARTLMDSPSRIETLKGFAAASFGAGHVLQLIQHTGCNKSNLIHLQKLYETLGPPPTNLHPYIELDRRYYLSRVCDVAKALRGKPIAEKIDWNQILKIGNKIFDAWEESQTQAERAVVLQDQLKLRGELLQDIQQKVKASNSPPPKVTNFADMFEFLAAHTDHPEQIFQAEILPNLLDPQELIEGSALRNLARHRLIQIGIKAQLQFEQNLRFSRQLSEFVDPELATDPFSGQPFRYEVSNDVLKVYSVGPNRQNDQGEGTIHGGQDIVLTIEGINPLLSF